MPAPVPSKGNTPLSQVLNGGSTMGGTDMSQLLTIANNSNQLIQAIGRLTEVIKTGLAKHSSGS